MPGFIKFFLLICTLALSVSSCYTPPAIPTPSLAIPKPSATQTVSAPIPTNVEPSVTPGTVNIKVRLPDAPQIPPSDVLDQVVFAGVGGGEHVCKDPAQLCVEPRENGVYVVGFEPYQEIVVLMYQHVSEGYHYIYYTQWAGKAGMNGTQWIEIPDVDPTAQFVVLDAMSNTFLVAWAPLTLEYESYYLRRYSPCTEADYQSRLKLGDKVRVAYVNGTNLRLRNSPDHRSSTNVIGGIPEGTELYIDAGPECRGGWVWWQVRYQGQSGWVSEGNGADWLLEPWQ